MDGMDAVLDTPEIDAELGELETQEGDSPESPEVADGEEATSASAKDDPYTTKFSREFRAATKAWEAANPDQAKFAKASRDNHARLFALQQLEPKGVDGVREKYALLESLAVGDVRGAEAITELQERLTQTEEVDSLLASGDPKALDALGDDFNSGLAKLTPTILDRVMKSDPAAYNAAILPHFVSALASSDLVKEFNSLVDVLNAQNDPRFDEKTKMQFTLQTLGRMGAWFNAQADKAGTLKTPAATDTDRDKFQQERTQFEQEKQEQHWKTNIRPDAVKMENDKFDELFKPYAQRLKLSETQKQAAISDFKAKIAAACKADPNYDKQLKLYRGQKNPDPAAVKNWIKINLAAKGKQAFEAVKAERWDSFLSGGKPKPAVAARPGVAKPAVVSGRQVQVVSVKPPMHEIDHQGTPLSDLTQKIYRLRTGKWIQVRKP
jgi:hypothetical protein